MNFVRDIWLVEVVESSRHNETGTDNKTGTDRDELQNQNLN